MQRHERAKHQHNRSEHKTAPGASTSTNRPWCAALRATACAVVEVQQNRPSRPRNRADQRAFRAELGGCLPVNLSKFCSFCSIPAGHCGHHSTSLLSVFVFVNNFMNGSPYTILLTCVSARLLAHPVDDAHHLRSSTVWHGLSSVASPPPQPGAAPFPLSSSARFFPCTNVLVNWP